MAKNDHQRSVYLKNTRIWEALDQIADKEKRSMSFILERILEENPDIINTIGKRKK